VPDSLEPLVPRGSARPGRRLGRVLLTVGLAVVAILGFGIVGGPLLLRGPLLARLILSAFPPIAGHLDLGAASLEPFAVVHFLLGQPFKVALERVGVTDPAGRPVFFAGEITAHVQVQRNPLAIAVRDLRVGPGIWKMLYDRRRGISLAAAFAATKRRAGEPSEAARKLAGGFSLDLERVELVDLDFVLDFPDWGLELAHASARGSFHTASQPGRRPTMGFDVQDVRAGGGSRLRVGRVDKPWSAELPFDVVAIARAATPADHPGDLQLEVSRASTGRATLSGTSTFHGVFAPAGPAGPGVDLEARWTSFADAARVLRAGWRPVVARVMGTEALDIVASAHGPFAALAGHVEARAERLTLAMGVTPDLHADADLTLRGFDTSSRLPPSLRGLLGGTATGRARVEAQLATSIGRVTGEVAELDLRLDRAHPGFFPPRWRVRRASAPSGAPPAPEGSKQVLDTTIASGRLEHGVILLHGFGITVGGGRLRGEASLTAFDRRSGQTLREPLVDASVLFDRLDLGMLGPPMRGTRLSGSVTAK